MDIQGDMQITLVIKAPNQRMEDQTVDCMMGWTIRKLKHHLERVYPSKPKHHEQRLIYSGKLLQDHLTLKEILKQYDQDVNSSTHTVHLVCSNNPSSLSNPTSTSTSQRAKEQPSPHSTDTNLPPQGSSNPNLPNSSGQSNATDSQNDGLRYRGAHSQSPNVPISSGFQAFPPQQPPFSMANPSPPAGYPYTPEQYAWMVQQQQAYSQYMMQYMQYYQQSLYNSGYQFVPGSTIPPVNPLNMPTPPVSPLPQQQPQQHQPAAPPLQQQQPAAGAANGNNAPRGNNVRMNAQGGMEEDDEDDRDPRDWLHHTYFIMRFITFVGIIVFYSSFSRFIMVMAGFLVIYFFQKVRVAREQNVRRQQEQQQREAEAQQQQQREAEAQQQQQRETEAQQQDEGQQQQPETVPPQVQQEEEAREDVNPEENNSPSPEEPNAASNQPQEEEGEAQEEGNKLIRSLYFIFKTVESFFSSLVPAPPELMEAN